MTKIEKAFRFLVKANRPMPGDAISAELARPFGGKVVGSTAIGSMMSDLRKKDCVVKRIYKGINPKTGSQINFYHLVSWPESLFNEWMKEAA